LCVKKQNQPGLYGHFFQSYLLNLTEKVWAIFSRTHLVTLVGKDVVRVELLLLDATIF
jgi:hypothetical protein